MRGHAGRGVPPACDRARSLLRGAPPPRLTWQRLPQGHPGRQRPWMRRSWPWARQADAGGCSSCCCGWRLAAAAARLGGPAAGAGAHRRRRHAAVTAAAPGEELADLGLAVHAPALQQEVADAGQRRPAAAGLRRGGRGGGRRGGAWPWPCTGPGQAGLPHWLRGRPAAGAGLGLPWRRLVLALLRWLLVRLVLVLVLLVAAPRLLLLLLHVAV